MLEARFGSGAEARRLAANSGEEWVVAAVERSLLRGGSTGDGPRREASRLLGSAPRELRSVLSEYAVLLRALDGDTTVSAIDSLARSARSLVVRRELRPSAARAWLATADTAAALPLIERLARSGRDDAAAWSELWVRVALGSGGSVVEAAREFCGRHPGESALEILGLPALRAALEKGERRMLEVESLAALGRLDEAIALCGEALGGPDADADADIELRMRRAELLISSGAVEAGRAAWRELDRRPRVGERAVLAIARSHKAKGDIESAVGAYLELAERFPRWRARGLWAAAWLEEQRGDRAAAITLLERMIEGGAGGGLLSEALLHRALLRLELGDDGAARRDARRLAERGATAVLRDAGTYWAWVAEGRADRLPDLPPASAYLELLRPSARSESGPFELKRVEALRDSLLATTLTGAAEMRVGLREVLDRTLALASLGFDRWARRELLAVERMHPRDGAEALAVAKSALELGALDIAARIVRPRLEGRGWAPGDLEWDLLLHPLVYLPLVEKALGPGADPLLGCAIIEAESAGNRTARSPAGAVGLMQLLPSTAAAIVAKGRAEGEERIPADLTHPATNIRLGCAHLAELLRRYEGREERALAAYNAGAAAVDLWEARTPGRDAAHFTDGAEYAETRAYIKRVLSTRAAMARVIGSFGEEEGARIRVRK
ncbi:MAG: hypothetical protein CME06_08605 [Gemmatimonadetes bacterium]|nr:hypothetical protein [Gemmatimonadota bacterium]